MPVNSELRASWVATVDNLDWPSKASSQILNTSERVTAQKAELLRIVDEAVKMGMTDIIFHVGPCADAFYRSSFLPWSSYLTGSLGKDPGFDPLGFAVEAAHAKGLKLHAWLNPYRVSMDTKQETINSLENSDPNSHESIYKRHKDWIGIAYDRFVLNPGIPEVRAWVKDRVTEIVKNYSVDAIHFDDYFYYESKASYLDDDETYKKYRCNFDNKVDWRRNNTYLLITEVSEAIKSIKSNVQFGISPAGVWRNKKFDLKDPAKIDPNGSDTEVQVTNFDGSYADTRQWVLKEKIDYIVPQIYWTFEREIARYNVIAQWWANTVKGTHVKLYIGMALYKVGIPSTVEPDWTFEDGVPEIKRQLDLNNSTPQIQGSILFRHLSLRKPQAQSVARYIREQWSQPMESTN